MIRKTWMTTMIMIRECTDSLTSLLESFSHFDHNIFVFRFFRKEQTPTVLLARARSSDTLLSLRLSMLFSWLELSDLQTIFYVREDGNHQKKTNGGEINLEKVALEVRFFLRTCV